MKKLLMLFTSIILCGCSQNEEPEYMIYLGEVQYAHGGHSALTLQFHTDQHSESNCQITIGDSSGAHTYHSNYEEHERSYMLKNNDLAQIIPLSYTLKWDENVKAYNKLEGASADGSITALLTGHSTGSNVNSGNATGTTYSGRCQAITQKGTQCLRNAQPGRRYCWQHP